MRIPFAALAAPGALVAVLAGCVGPAARSSNALSSDAVNIATEPVNGIRVRGRCDVAPSMVPIASRTRIVRVDAGRCHLTHLGTVRVELEQQLNVVLGTQTAQLTLTTADGAEVQLSAAGDSDGQGDALRFNGAARVVGGTGRFLGATGVVRTEGAGAAGGGRGVLKIDGWITYQGADPFGPAGGGDR